MGPVVADTHAFVWYLLSPKRLSVKALEAFEEALTAGERVFVASITRVKLVYLVEKGKLPARALKRLQNELEKPDALFVIVPLDKEVALTISKISRDVVADMPERIIAATALYLGMPLISRGRKITASNLKVIW